jgi:hypothetical protein
MAPVFFLLVNRVFSPQYLVLMLVAWAIAGALLVESPKEQLTIGLAIMAATTANTLVYPHSLFHLELWRLASATLFVIGLATSIWLAVRAVQRSRARQPRSAASPARPLVPTEAP